MEKQARVILPEDIQEATRIGRAICKISKKSEPPNGTTIICADEKTATGCRAKKDLNRVGGYSGCKVRDTVDHTINGIQQQNLERYGYTITEK